MSSSIGSPGETCRLHLGENFVCLERPGFPDERRAFLAGEAAYLGALREVARFCEGPVVVVLPERAFAIAQRGPRRFGWLRSRRALARALRVGWTEVLVAVGRADGIVRHVGLASATVRETVGFLAPNGIRVKAIEPGPALLRGGTVPSFPVRLWGEASASAGVTGFLRRLACAPRATLAAGAVSAAMLALALIGGTGFEGGGAPGPAPAVVSAEGSDKLQPASGARVDWGAPPAVLSAAPALNAGRPPERPRLAVLASEAPLRRKPAPLSQAAAEPGSVVVASRSVPAEVREAALAAAAGLRSNGVRLAAAGPLPRPIGPDVAAATPGGAGEVRPLPRPGATGPVAVAAMVAEGGDGRPLPRPFGDAQRLAQAVDAAVTAAVPQAVSAGNRPEPRSFVDGPPVAQGAAPIALAGSAAVQPAPAPPVQVARAEPARPIATMVQPQPVRQAAPVQTVSRGSGQVALIGVFGTSSRRHALVRLPNGSVQRVRAGDAVNGVQIAAVGADSVRVRVNGRDGVLTVPE